MFKRGNESSSNHLESHRFFSAAKATQVPKVGSFDAALHNPGRDLKDRQAPVGKHGSVKGTEPTASIKTNLSLYTWPVQDNEPKKTGAFI